MLPALQTPSAGLGSPTPPALGTIVDALLTAQFPLIVTANAGRNPNTVPLLAELSTLLAIGVYTSCPSSVCMPWTHPNYLGLSFGGKNDLLDHADVLILIDVDIPWIDTHGNRPRDDARVFVIDSDPLKTTLSWSHVDADILCRADAEAALAQLVRAVDAPDARAAASSVLPTRQERLQRLRDLLHQVRELNEEQDAIVFGDTFPKVKKLVRAHRRCRKIRT